MRVAVVGLGFMGATHARAWTRVPGAELFAVVSRDGKKLTGDLRDSGGNLGREAVRLDFSGVRKYATLDALLNDAEVDAVDLCIPTDQHVSAAIQALRHGKHVLVEKPLALTGADAQRLADEAEQSGLVLMCAQVLRFMPAYVQAHDLLPTLGRIRSALFRRRCAAPAWSNWLGDPKRSGGGAFDLLIHDADYARWVFGMPPHIESNGARDFQHGIDLVTGTLSYEGFDVTITGGWHLASAYPFAMEFTIVGEMGVLEYCCGLLTLYRTKSGPVPVDLGTGDAFEAELAEFARCVARGKQSAVCPVRQSVDAVRIMESLVNRGVGDA